MHKVTLRYEKKYTEYVSVDLSVMLVVLVGWLCW